MADRFYSTNKGAQLPINVTEGGSTGGGQVELRISDTIYNDKLAAILAVESILNYLKTKETWPIA